MTRPSLAGIEKRAAAATEGPWRSQRFTVVPPGVGFDEPGDEVALTQWPVNAEFIAETRTAVPALTAAVRDVLTALAPHWDAQVRREAKFGRSGSACVCEACNAMRALAAHLDLTDPEGDPT